MADDSQFSPTASFDRSRLWSRPPGHPAASDREYLSLQKSNGPIGRTLFGRASDRESLSNPARQQLHSAPFPESSVPLRNPPTPSLDRRPLCPCHPGSNPPPLA